MFEIAGGTVGGEQRLRRGFVSSTAPSICRDPGLRAWSNACGEASFLRRAEDVVSKPRVDRSNACGEASFLRHRCEHRASRARWQEQRLRRGFVSSTRLLSPPHRPHYCMEQRLRRGFVSSTGVRSRGPSGAADRSNACGEASFLRQLPLRPYFEAHQGSNACGEASFLRRGLRVGGGRGHPEHGATPAERLRFFDGPSARDADATWREQRLRD